MPVVDCPNNEFDEFTFNLPSCNHIDNSININCSKYIVNYVSLGFCDKTYIDNESCLDCLYAYNLKQDHHNIQFLKNDLIIISTNFNLENNKYYIIKVNNIYQIMKLLVVENKLVLMPIDLDVQCNIVDDSNNLPDNIKIIAKIVEIRRAF